MISFPAFLDGTTVKKDASKDVSSLVRFLPQEGRDESRWNIFPKIEHCQKAFLLNLPAEISLFMEGTIFHGGTR